VAALDDVVRLVGEDEAGLVSHDGEETIFRLVPHHCSAGKSANAEPVPI